MAIFGAMFNGATRPAIGSPGAIYPVGTNSPDDAEPAVIPSYGAMGSSIFAPIAGLDFLLMETGEFILQEDDVSKIILE